MPRPPRPPRPPWAPWEQASRAGRRDRAAGRPGGQVEVPVIASRGCAGSDPAPTLAEFGKLGAYGGVMRWSSRPLRWPDWTAAVPLRHTLWLQRALLLLRRAVSEFRADHCPQFAAAISFHLLFSVFPLTITAVGIMGLLTQDAHARTAVATAVVKVVPLSRAGRQQLHGLLTSVSGGAGALGLLGLLGVMWSASGVMAAVRTALNVAWDTTSKRPFLRGKAVDLALVAGVFLIVGATLGLTIFASIARQGATHLPGALRVLAPLAGAAVSVAVFAASAALLFATFSFLYRLVPAAPTRLRGIWPGALAATAGFEALQYGFSAYVAYLAHYNKVYGSLGAVIAFLFYVYLASMVFLFGAEVASEYPRLPAPATRPAPGPPGQTGLVGRGREARRGG